MNERLEDILKKYKELVNFADFSFFIHDLTKAHIKFFENPFNHTNSNDYDKNFPDIKEFIDKYQIKIKKRLPANSFKYRDKDKKEKNFSEIISLFSSVITHHSNNIENFSLIDYILYAAFGGVDGIESDYGKGVEDKEKKIFEQSLKEFLILSPIFSPKLYLSENVILKNTENILEKLKQINVKINNENIIESNLFEIKESLRKDFSSFLGETRFPLNDTTLYHHCHLSSALGKALFVKILVEAENIENYHVPIRNPRFQDEDIKESQEYSSFNLILLNVPTEILLKNISKMPVLSGYYKKISEIFKVLTIYLEQILPVGTKVYEDKNSIGFITPKFSKKIEKFNEELINIIQNKFHQITKDVLKEEIKLPFRIYHRCFVDKDVPVDKNQDCLKKYPLNELLNLKEKSKDVWTNEDVKFLLELENKDYIKCPVCNFYVISRQNQEYCSVCDTVYTSRKKDFLSKQIENEAFVFEEVADERNFLCAIYLKLNCDYFLNGRVFEDIFKLYNENAKTCRKSSESFKPPSPSRLFTLLEDNVYFFNILKEKILTIVDKCERKEYKDFYKELFSEKEFNKIKNSEYKKFIQIHKDYREFLFLIPAKNLIKVLKLIKKEFTEQYRHVPDKLPLYIATGIFKHKFPFNVVYRTLKKVIDIFHNKTEKCKFEIKEEKIVFRNNGKIICEYIKDNFNEYTKSSINLSWTDGFYKNWGDRESVVFWENLTDSESLEILPSYMINMVIDSSQKRLDLKENESIQLGIFKEDYNTIWAVDCIDDLINIFENNFVNKNQIYHFIELIFDKYETFFNEQKIFNDFIKMVLNSLNLKRKLSATQINFITESINTGLFFEAFEVYKYGS